MPQRMTIFVTAILVIVVAAVSLTARTSIAERAADECITKPNSTPPQGSHWYYRIDRATRRQCWYLGAEGEKVRARKVGSRMKSAAPKAPPQSMPPQSTVQTPEETKAAEPAPAQTASADATHAPAIAPDAPVGEAPVGVDDSAAAFSTRWPALPKPADPVEREPTSMSNSYADEQSTAGPPEGAPLAWPIVASVGASAAAGRMVESVFSSDRMLALLAGALGLAAIFIGMVFNPSKGRRVAQRRVRKRWWKSASNADHVDPGFGDPLAAARRVDLTSKPVARTREPHKSSGAKRGDSGHDLEASLQKLLRDWKRAAA
jgi:hypothetical protein